jgi:phosphoribosylanthranilate isomerase
LHGDEAPAEYPAGVRVWKAVRVEEAFDIAAWRDCAAEALLLDGPAGALWGGAGKAFDWRRARGAARIVLAGGLDASNVREAIRQAQPWGVDACSRLESAPGKKDHRKMAAFLKAALEPL